jgi:hypothetical protein
LKLNFLVTAIAALFPIAVGFVWYSDKVFGTRWKALTGLNDETLKNSNMGVILGACFVLSFLLALAMQFVVIHQWHLYSILADEPAINDPYSELSLRVNDFMSQYGHNFRTFKHGAFHGAFAGFTFAMPVLAINALFERKKFAYIAIHTAYWMITLGLMGGVICQFN